MAYKNYVDWNTVPIIMDIPLAAQLVGMSAEYLRKQAIKKKFPAYKISPRVWRVNKEDLVNWIESFKNN